MVYEVRSTFRSRPELPLPEVQGEASGVSMEKRTPEFWRAAWALRKVGKNPLPVPNTFRDAEHRRQFSEESTKLVRELDDRKKVRDALTAIRADFQQQRDTMLAQIRSPGGLGAAAVRSILERLTNCEMTLQTLPRLLAEVDDEESEG